MPPKTLEATEVDGDPGLFEEQNVHEIYDEIADHFSSTRYKPWPIIANFIASLSSGWVGLDSGTGNGKYLPLPLDRPGQLMTIGMDRSKNLLAIARHAGGGDVIREVVQGNVLDNPWRNGIFDYAISIATIHHLATHERRRSAVKVSCLLVSGVFVLMSPFQRLLQAVSPTHGRVLIYVWAIEQDELSKRKVVADEVVGHPQGKDVVVPWVLSKELSKTGATSESREPQVFNRYYHMFAKGELSGLVAEAAAEMGLSVGRAEERCGAGIAGLEIIQDGWERSNYYVELRLWKNGI
ncbi:hypothetical protein BJ165DRAFT_1354452 [Panaeolus papilionaceus]|nr:hypothetical protein BJ165DRAFT_1354452 [Panaeolus papilionaceus]